MQHKDILKLLFPIELGGVFDEDITLEGQHLDTAQTNAETLLAELFPDKTIELIADWERVYGIIPPANTRQAYLSRASIAYLSDGSQVASGAPRYESGKYDKGIMSEEGTTNLFPDASAFSFASPWTSDTLNGTYVVSIKSGTGALVLTGGATGTVIVGSYLVITVSSATVTFTPTGGTPTYCQLELKAYQTSWQRPVDGARVAEILSFQTASVLSQSAGTWGQWVKVNDVIKRQILNFYPTIFHIQSSNMGVFGSGIWLMHYSNTSNWVLQIRDENNNTKTVSIADSYTPNGDHRFLVTWNAIEAKVYVDGILRATMNAPFLPVAFGSSAYIGGYNGGSLYHGNTIYDDVQIWTRVLSETEAAADYARGAAGVPGAGTTALFPFDTDLYSIDLVARRTAVVQKLRLRGSLTRQYFVDLAAAVGYTITIEEIPPNDAGYGGAWDTINVWKVHVPIGAKEITDFTAGDSGAGDLLTDWPSEDILENLFNDLKPAHTQVYFVYE